jgi:glycerol kinase
MEIAARAEGARAMRNANITAADPAVRSASPTSETTIVWKPEDRAPVSTAIVRGHATDRIVNALSPHKERLFAHRSSPATYFSGAIQWILDTVPGVRGRPAGRAVFSNRTPGSSGTDRRPRRRGPCHRRDECQPTMLMSLGAACGGDRFGC